MQPDSEAIVSAIMTSGDPIGIMPGLNDSLIHLLQNYRPGDLGVCVVDQRLQLTLPVPDWATYMWSFAGSSTDAAAKATPTLLETVPENERWEVLNLRLARASGDNTLNQVRLTVPAAYSDGNDSAVPVARLTTAATAIFWPDSSGIQTLAEYVEGKGVVWEPGTLVQYTPEGAGASETVFNYELLVKRTKLYRAMVPS